MDANVQNKTGGKNFFYKYYRIIVIPVVFFLYLSSYYFLNPYQDFEQNTLLVLDWTVDIFIILVYCAVLTELSLFVGRSLNYWISWEQKPIFRAFAQFICLIAGNILLNYSFSYLWQFFYSWTPLKESELVQIWQSNLMAAILSLFISFIHTSIFLLNRWRVTSEEAAELKIKASELQEAVTRSELESLKLQLDPHFIFNNFSTLTELIHEDQQSAASFLENITRVYRYMISNLDKDTITVREEIEFLNAYFYLLKKRLGEKVELKLQIDMSCLDLHLPPLTLQLLVENAVKHNSATIANPLIIAIYSDVGDLVVRNNLQATSGKNFISTGVGNKNIEFRYKILFDRMPVFSESNGFYCVRLPLI
ncbi:histidine kinase [Flavobacterium piscis]|jgi:two-component system LytT family sensor kinase|uniref:Histidine kinase n=1 Tax=Flavobacterium piscis TaxID=1114874 RepID=A0ABX2XHN2_9FLAO|nr:histidine kinase [Flavobacterium piscis]OCB73477.1 histidine kinase [Flavobacterium piscis]OXE96341.1 histidine kinase [Flavobacterium piscis]